MGQTELATERAHRAIRLSPFDPLNVRAYDALAIAHFQLGRFADALIAARRAIDLAPEFSVPHAHIAAALVRLGRVEEAKAAARQLLALNRPSQSVGSQPPSTYRQPYSHRLPYRECASCPDAHTAKAIQVHLDVVESVMSVNGPRLGAFCGQLNFRI
jgi:Flp pilus assembly protein TadD